MLPGPDGCLNPGEGGGGSYPIVNYRNDTLKCSYWDKDTMDTAQYGQNYVPFESDISIQNPVSAYLFKVRPSTTRGLLLIPLRIVGRCLVLSQGARF